MCRRALLLLMLLMTSGTGISSVAPRSLIIESFQADITVQANGAIEVTETIRPRFTGSWNGIYRTIPVQYRTPQGFNYTLWLDLQSITDEHGRQLRYQSSRQRHYRKFKIWIPGAQDATRTVIIRYRVRNGLKFFQEHDELYWNITGDEWEIPIRSASARIDLPAGVTGLRATAFTGGYGSRQQAAKVEMGEHVVTVRTLRSLDFRQGLTVAVGWDPGVVHRPSALEQTGSFLRSNWILSIPLLAFIIICWFWYRQGRDPRRRPIVPQYEPPEGMTPAEVGTLVDNYPHLRDITATLVDLAVRGFILIEEREKEQFFGFWSKKDYAFILRKQRAEWGALLPHEREVLTALFSSGRRQTIELSELENKFYKHLPDIRDRIFDRLVERRYYLRRPDKVRKFFLIGALLIGALLFLVTPFYVAIGVSSLTAFMTGLLTTAILAGFGWFMPARTVAGTRALEGVLGFEEFLDRVESDRFERVVKTPEMFERYLPFAMALGLEKNWARAFEGIYQQQPEWYRGGSFQTFQTRSFVSDLGRMSSQTASTLSSSPRSSGGSGFGGGGSSGGGFGGGGGGGF